MQPPKLLDQLRSAIRMRHYSRRTAEAYVRWTRRFILFNEKRHPKELVAAEIRRYLSHLATEEDVAASTQNQPLNALVFLYRHVLDQPFPDVGEVVRAKRPSRLPVVFTPEEVTQVLAELEGTYALVAQLLYGSGLRLLECLRLRVKDLDVARGEILVRHGKGAKDRITMLPSSLEAPLRQHLVGVRRLHEQDLRQGYGAVYLPYALARKYPNAARS